MDFFSDSSRFLAQAPTLYAMPEPTEPDWQVDRFNQMRMAAGQRNGFRKQMGGMQDVDLRMFQHEYDHPLELHDENTTHQRYPQSTNHLADAKWVADINMDTPPASGFASGPCEGYFEAQARNSGHLQFPRHGTHELNSTSRPGSVRSGFGLQQFQKDVSEIANVDQRPGIERASTAPEHRVTRPAIPRLEPPALKRGGTSDDGDDDDAPCDDSKNRGGKRQRIPHTAVERRYRENLNAHLDKLRQTVPAMANRRGEKHEGVKPSKCEVLSGAIEHIGALDKENQALKGEVKLMQERLKELERWYRRDGRRVELGASS